MYSGYIYKFTLIPTGMIYVGKHNRGVFDEAYYGSGVRWKAVIANYSTKDILREVLEWVEDPEDLNLREEYWINYLDACNPVIGYNLAPGSGGLLNHSPETCQKISESSKQKRWMHKGDSSTFANPSRICRLLADGWEFGRGSSMCKDHYKDTQRSAKISKKTRGKLIYTNLHENIRIDPSESAYYESLGYFRGYSRDGKLVSAVIITNGKIDKRVQHSKLEISLQAGWVEGSSTSFSDEENIHIYDNFKATQEANQRARVAKYKESYTNREVTLDTRVKISATLKHRDLNSDEIAALEQRMYYRSLTASEKKLFNHRKRKQFSNTAEHRKKLSDAHIGLQKGSIWINDGTINKRVTPQEFADVYSKEGFSKGRLKNANK